MKAILLVPTPKWRDALLQSSGCGARVPSVGLDPQDNVTWREGWGVGTAAEGLGFTIALVLAWDGKVNVDGCDRMQRVREHPVQVRTGDMETCLELATFAERYGYGKVVVVE